MSVIKVKKRNGDIVDFDPNKIEHAVYSALKNVGQDDKTIAYTITKDVTLGVNELYSNDVPTVEQIQDLVEDILIHYDYSDVAKHYILYRAMRAQIREKRMVAVEVEKTIEEYLNQLDWRVNENANQGYSIGGMILNTAGKVTANYWLSHIYPLAIGDAHRNGDYHIHDLSMFAGYCAGWSLRALLEEGFNGVSNKTESGPPKHLSSAVAQMVNFFGTLQNEWAGAQAFSSLDTYLAPYVKKYELELREDIQKEKIEFPSEEAMEKYLEKKVYQYVYQNIQSFIFNLNIPSRWGTQTPFTNVTFDWTVPDDLKDKHLMLGGELFPYSFGQLTKEMKVVNHAFIAVMTKGDSKGRTFTFPIPTYNITKEFDWENPDNLPLFEMTAKYGTPYFQNFLNSDLNPSDVRSMCCRLQLDLTELRKRGGGLFGSAEMTGSIGVVTINLPRIGYMHRGNKEKFIERVDYLMELAKTSLELKRKEIQKWLDRGLFPFTKRYLGHLNNHFSTIGINGMNEAVRNFTEDKENITTKFGQEFSNEILDHIRTVMTKYQEETGNLYNLEATPAEGTTTRFAKEDIKRLPDIIQAGTKETPYYTNSSQLPVEFTDDLFDSLDLQDDLQTKYTGGTVFHCYMGERISGPEACRNLIKKVLSRYKMPYITISPTFSICPKHGYLEGEYDYCPKCDAELGIPLENRFDHDTRFKYTSVTAQRKVQ
jgi:ribonucleoside-triphosphate reductase (formate)